MKIAKRVALALVLGFIVFAFFAGIFDHSKKEFPQTATASILPIDDKQEGKLPKIEKTNGKKTAKAIFPLIALLGDENESVRWHAVFALKEFGKPVIQPLVDLIKKKPSKIILLNAIKTLEGIKDPETVEVLVALTKDSDAEVRAYSASALGEIARKQKIFSN